MKFNPVAVVVLLIPAFTDAIGQDSAQKIPVIIDTDVGTDIDDAFALALALASPELDVRGVTTVSADAHTRARIVCRLLEAVGRPEIPVAAGRPPRQTPEVKGQYQYGLRPSRKRPLQESAVEFLFRQVKLNPREITLITLGDLTNVAELIRQHPEAKPWIRQVVLMGGSLRVGYNGQPPPAREWNIRADVDAAQTVFRSGLRLVVAPVDATTQVKLVEPLRRQVFATDTPLCRHLHALYELWGKTTPTLFDPVAVTMAFDESFCTIEELRVEVDDRGFTRVRDGVANCRAAMSIRSAEFLHWYVERVGTELFQPRVASAGPTNVSQLAPQGGLPTRVHVVEDYETDIERRWWLAGRMVTQDVPIGSTRACGGVLCRDFDGRMGNQLEIYRAVVFNPVPGPPVGPRTRLSFRYCLRGTDTLRMQIYSLSNNYHRHLVLTGLPQGEWRSATADMTEARRPDGSGGPLAEGERIDDIQFYVDPTAELTIDDLVLYEAASSAEQRPFPKRIAFTAWFDTGRNPQHWPGDFEIARYGDEMRSRGARSVVNRETNSPWIRIDLRGQRPVGPRLRVRFRYLITGGDKLRVELAEADGASIEREIANVMPDRWMEADVEFVIPTPQDGKTPTVDQVRFLPEAGTKLLVDDLLLYEPADIR